MRQIERQLIEAVRLGITLDLRNTQVEAYYAWRMHTVTSPAGIPLRVRVLLHNSVIANIDKSNRYWSYVFSMSGHDTNTTRHRLRVLGIPIRKINGINTLMSTQGRYLVDPRTVYRVDGSPLGLSVMDYGLCPEDKDEQISYFESVLSLHSNG